MSCPELQVIIPVRAGGNPYITLESLGRSEYQDFDVIVVHDHQQNANAARNLGFAQADPGSEFLLFSDDDIEWYPDAIGRMVNVLRHNPAAGYAYGTYTMGGREYCNVQWSAARLRQSNFVSTMSVIRRSAFPGEWDEEVPRLQDWSMWLSMLENRWCGVHCGAVIFETAVRDGITRNGRVSYEEAERIVRQRHRLGRFAEVAG